jgi:hypothetical protein
MCPVFLRRWAEESVEAYKVDEVSRRLGTKQDPGSRRMSRRGEIEKREGKDRQKESDFHYCGPMCRHDSMGV